MKSQNITLEMISIFYLINEKIIFEMTQNRKNDQENLRNRFPFF